MDTSDLLYEGDGMNSGLRNFLYWVAVSFIEFKKPYAQYYSVLILLGHKSWVQFVLFILVL